MAYTFRGQTPNGFALELAKGNLWLAWLLLGLGSLCLTGSLFLLVAGNWQMLPAFLGPGLILLGAGLAVSWLWHRLPVSLVFNNQAQRLFISERAGPSGWLGYDRLDRFERRYFFGEDSARQEVLLAETDGSRWYLGLGSEKATAEMLEQLEQNVSLPGTAASPLPPLPEWLERSELTDRTLFLWPVRAALPLAPSLLILAGLLLAVAYFALQNSPALPAVTMGLLAATGVALAGDFIRQRLQQGQFYGIETDGRNLVHGRGGVADWKVGAASLPVAEIHSLLYDFYPNTYYPDLLLMSRPLQEKLERMGNINRMKTRDLVRWVKSQHKAHAIPVAGFTTSEVLSLKQHLEAVVRERGGSPSAFGKSAG